MASIWTFQSTGLPSEPSACVLKHRLSSSSLTEFGTNYRLGCGARGHLNWTSKKLGSLFLIRAANSGAKVEELKIEGKVVRSSHFSVHKFQGLVGTIPSSVLVIRRNAASGIFLGLCVATAFFIIAVKVYMTRRSRYSYPGSVADLIRRGQLRPDRRGISRPLKYEDPFNNPLVKISKNNSTIEMCGNVYRLAPVTLTEEQRANHQKRRSQAYQWKRPKIFLKEGDSVPPGVDPDSIRWIPANHPFASTASDIDEDLAQKNVYQKHGVPFRIQAEHEALQRKLEALHGQKKLNKLVVDPSNGKDLERPFKSCIKSHELAEQNLSDGQASSSIPAESEHESDSSGSDLVSEKVQELPPKR